MPISLDHIEAHPLDWPGVYERTPPTDRNRWPTRGASFAEVRDDLVEEIRRTADDGSTFVISTNIQTYEQGGREIPYASQPEPDDPGVAVYLIIDETPRVFACDRYERVVGNMAALRRTLMQLRQIAKRGVNEGRRAYQGFPALPAPGSSTGPKWWTVLGVKPDVTYQEARAAYRERARETHPDHGGSTGAFHRVQSAWTQARQALRRPAEGAPS